MQCRGRELLSARLWGVPHLRAIVSLVAAVVILAGAPGCAERPPERWASWQELRSFPAENVSRVVLGLAPKPRLKQYQFEITHPFAARLFVDSLRASREPAKQATTAYDVPSVLRFETKQGDALEVPLEVDPGRPQAVKWIGDPARLPSADLNALVSMVVGIRGIQSRPPMRSDRMLDGTEYEGLPFTHDEVRFFVKERRYRMALAIYTETRRLFAAKPKPLSALDRAQWGGWVDDERLLFQDMGRYVDAAECCEEYVRIHLGDSRSWIMRDTEVNAEFRAKYRMFPLAGRLYLRGGEYRKALGAFEKGQTLIADRAVSTMSPREVTEIKVASLYRCKLGAADALRRAGRYREALAAYRWLLKQWGKGSALRREVLHNMPTKMAENFRKELDEALSRTIPDAIRDCQAHLRRAEKP